MSQKRTLSTDVPAHIGQTITLKGWFHNLRELGNVNFLLIRDGWGIVQCVVDRSIVQQLRTIGVESIISVTGAVVAANQAPNGIELHNCEVSAIEAIQEQLPFELNQKKIKAGLDTFLNHAQIGFRHPKRKALLRLGAGIISGFRQTLALAGFTEIQSPKLVASATEGGANVFTVDYFGKPAFLAQSPQFYKQMMVGVFERVFEVGPVFRAEPHNTSRHINEYVSLDAEFGFIEDHTTIMNMATKVIQGILSFLVQHHRTEAKALNIMYPPCLNPRQLLDFPKPKS